ncbi:MAG: hypothetical protein QIT35_gp84 [Methanophagales virus PBV299]|uniref:Uncharacterized protein n=1 Tax=Methanophagales virus PBV299 TaxID=2987730 RepID=A0ABY6GLJ3_9CAUD|nr:MAG: hypothetical protein QIT35_gp84 [Methanophagales virus PBV299]UYL64880.1 MAG: hypothetical protein OFDIEDLO_00084 [Methanophagales virus PBV299]
MVNIEVSGNSKSKEYPRANNIFALIDAISSISERAHCSETPSLRAAKRLTMCLMIAPLMLRSKASTKFGMIVISIAYSLKAVYGTHSPSSVYLKNMLNDTIVFTDGEWFDSTKLNSLSTKVP